MLTNVRRRSSPLTSALAMAHILQQDRLGCGPNTDDRRRRCGRSSRPGRGVLICGVAAGGLAGFMVADSQGKWTGLDIDVCRAVAAALFGDSEKVKYVPLSGV